MAQATTKIEDYAFLSDTQTGALVSRDGCVDWLCFPRFDSPACFASLVGDKENGHWRFFPKENVEATRRHYRGETLILETEKTASAHFPCRQPAKQNKRANRTGGSKANQHSRRGSPARRSAYR